MKSLQTTDGCQVMVTAHLTLSAKTISVVLMVMFMDAKQYIQQYISLYYGDLNSGGNRDTW